MEYPRYMREPGQNDFNGAPMPEPYPPYQKPYPNPPYISPDYNIPAYPNLPYPAYPDNPYTNPPYQKPGYEMPGYKMPEYANPDNMMPGYHMPEYVMPKYVSPDNTMPCYEMPEYENPDYHVPTNDNMPGYEMPEHEMPKPNMPGYEMPGYEMPEPNMPGYEMPGYEMPKPNMPGHEMPGYEMPKPNMPGYEMPEHEMPKPNMPGYEMPEHEMPKPNMPGHEMPEHEMPKPNMPGHENVHPKSCPKGTVPYTVRMGDTLYSISRMYGISIDDIMAVNPQIKDPNRIYPGQLLCIPNQKQCDGFLYTIKPGDTLNHIAMSFGLSLEELLRANPDINPESYRDGEVLCIPEVNPCPGNTMAYVVKKNDDLTGILTQTNVSLNALMAANPAFDPYNIIPQTRLCVIPTPCEPVCPKEKRMTIPEKIKNINQLAEFLKTTTDAILLANPNYPPCHFRSGNSFCKP